VIVIIDSSLRVILILMSDSRKTRAEIVIFETGFEKKCIENFAGK